MSHVDDMLDDWVDGGLSEADRAAVERHLAGCERCRRGADAIRAVVAAARGLPKEIEPPRDLWPAVRDDLAAAPTPRRSVWAAAGASAALLFLAASCAGLIGLGAVTQWMEARHAEVVEAQAILADGDLPAAAARIDELAAGGRAVEDAAYMAYLEGDYARADALLASLPETPELQLRRAIVALERRDLDAVKRFGEASGLGPGLILAAEVHLADAEPDEARALLGKVEGEPGTVGDTAASYLALLRSPDPYENGVAEATALWSLGERKVAVEAAAELLQARPESTSRDVDLLVWAGRAATSGAPDLAEELLDAMSFPPEGQAWRVVATRALIEAARGQTDESLRTFETLEVAGAPRDGIADARATAAALAKDPESAVRLVGGQRSVTAARALEQAGATYADVAPDDSFYGRYARSK
jgi:hypothetical protein